MEFQEAFDKVIVAEGGYVNDPHDNGGETFMGISRKFNPDSVLWKYVDAEKKKGGTNAQLTKRLKDNEAAVKAVYYIYYSKFWNPLRLSEVKDSKMQYQIFDDAVNRGVVAAIRTIQHLVGMSVTGRMSDELIYNINNYKYDKGRV